MQSGPANLRCVDASAQFLGALDGLTAPEAKRRAIGQQFLAVQRQVQGAGRSRAGSSARARSTRTRSSREGPRRGRRDQDAPQPRAEIDALMTRFSGRTQLIYIKTRCAPSASGRARAALSVAPALPGARVSVRLLCHDGEDDDADMRAKAAAAATIGARCVPLEASQGDARR